MPLVRGGTVWRVLAALLAVLAVAGAGFAARAKAATYTVAVTGDPTGTCPLTSNKCSLRQLINDENALSTAPSPPDTIVLRAGNYTLSQGPLAVNQSLIIVGAGAQSTQIDQETPLTAMTSRVFDIVGNPKVNPMPAVLISSVAMAFGKADSTNGYFGGDIRNRAILTLSEDLIEDGSAAGTGGGISNDGGMLILTHSLVWNNTSTTAPSAGPPVGGIGGGVENYGDDTVGAGQLFIDNSTIADNSAAELGGGVVNRCAGPSLECSSTGVNATTTIMNSTIADNDGGVEGVTGGGLLASQGTLSIGNSIVASNSVTNPATGAETPSNCGAGAAGVPNPGVLTSLGYNIETATDCGFKATGDHQSTDPQFLTGGLGFNGGNTETFALAATSPAVDAVPTSATGCWGTDQRDIARPQGTGCDIGAYELFQPVEGIQFTTVVGQVGATAATIDWGDGTTSMGTVNSRGQVTGTHTYAEEGIDHGEIDWANSDGAQEQTPFDIKVQDAPLTAKPVNFTAVSGASFGGPVATFTDANPGGTASDFTATIAWGDGTSSSGTVTAGKSGFVVSSTHTYANTGSFKTTVSIMDVGGSRATAHGTATVNPPPPTVTGLNPTAGPTAGGNSVTVTGTNLAGATTVDFGSSSATITGDTATSITATAPAGSATVDVTVTTTGGTSATSAADQYTYAPAPTVTQVSPTAGPTGGGTAVTITGTNFTNVTGVSFGSDGASSFEAVNSTTINAESPAGSGTVDVVVTTQNGGASATSPADQYTYVLAPTVTRGEPVRGPDGRRVDRNDRRQ